MTLLFYAADFRSQTASGAEALASFSELERAFKHTLLLPVSEHPPPGLFASPHVDWLTLPRGLRFGAQRKLLRDYARWFRPNATVFAGSGAQSLALGADVLFGHRFVMTPADDERDYGPLLAKIPQQAKVPQQAHEKLVRALKGILPLMFVLDEESPQASIESAIEAHPAAAEVRLYSSKPLNRATLEWLVTLSPRFNKRVVLIVRVLQGVVKNPRALKDLAFLLRYRQQVSVEFVSERDLGALSARALTATIGG